MIHLVTAYHPATRVLAFLLVSVALLNGGCRLGKPASGPPADKELQRFASLLTGSFSSEKQAQRDSTYFSISLVMSRIWEDRTDAIWLYVEQAMATTPAKPYRQRVYKLEHPGPDRFTSEIFTLKNPEAFIGLQQDAAKQALLTTEDIQLKDGCTVIMTESGGVYKGGTVEDHCPSDLRGATYATTKITLKKGLLVSWDQGFDATGRQVWGATEGGYEFVSQ
jgi:hypothetical protein